MRDGNARRTTKRYSGKEAKVRPHKKCIRNELEFTSLCLRDGVLMVDIQQSKQSGGESIHSDSRWASVVDVVDSGLLRGSRDGGAGSCWKVEPKPAGGPSIPSRGLSNAHQPGEPGIPWPPRRERRTKGGLSGKGCAGFGSRRSCDRRESKRMDAIASADGGPGMPQLQIANQASRTSRQHALAGATNRAPRGAK